MQVPFYRSLSFKLARNIILIAFFLGLVTAGNQIRGDLAQVRSEISSSILQIITMQRNAAAQAAWQYDNVLAARVLEGLTNYGPIVEAAITTDQGTVFAQKARTKEGNPERLAWLSDIVISTTKFSVELHTPEKKESIGGLEVRIDSALVARAFFDRTFRNIQLAVVPLVLLAVILVVMFHYALSRPLFQLSKGLSQVNTEHPTHSQLKFPHGHANDELALVVSTTNSLLSQFEELLAKYQKAEKELRAAEEKYRSIFDNAVEGIYQASLEGHFLTANPALAESLGYATPGELISEITDMEQQLYHDKEKRRETLTQLMRDGFIANDEALFRRKDGTLMWGSQNARIVRDKKGDPLFIEGMVGDITGPKQARADLARVEAQLLQAQKMESVGRLAGGVAHDFNNMLSVIVGYVEMILGEMSPGSPYYDELSEVQKAAQHSAEITRQLLAFARKQTIAPKILDLNETVSGMLKMLKRLLGEDIDLKWFPGKDLNMVKIDPLQIDQILANLCVNARDAIAGIGKLTIETGNAAFDEEYCVQHPGCLPGNYVLLAVSDNGCGMDQKVMDHLFEPFFTTKDVDRGTGLGLATVYGIVKQNQGFIKVYSEPEQGATFKIYLPRHLVEQEPPRVAVENQVEKHDHERILLVEDEPAILAMAKRMLEKMGYQVIPAKTPHEAVRFAQDGNARIDLLLTDVVMPEMNGRDLAKTLLALHPDLKVLFMSGYTANVIAHHGVLDDDVHFIQKPFSREELGFKVRNALSRCEVVANIGER